MSMKGERNPTKLDQDLFIFGYSCKIIRDDEKAFLLDQGKHLIPWIGDEAIYIDRYDVRGTVSDLTAKIDDGIQSNETDEDIEALCDAERYRALTTNEDEERLYHEEEIKRLQASVKEDNKYKQVCFSYNPDNENKQKEEQSDTVRDEESAPFTPSPLLDIPLNMILPKTAKQNAVIEKTASFICSQGPQMEVLLKMKQSANPLFQFLSFGDPLHPYYRLIIQNIQTGRYKFVEEAKSEEEDDAGYLHPSLAPSFVKAASPAPIVVPPITYKKSENCAYSMLVKNLKQKAAAIVRETPPNVTKNENCKENYSSNPGSEDCAHSISMKTIPSISERNAEYVNQTPRNAIEPPVHMKLIIEKMALYVAKNGADFESVVSRNNDDRFDFLRSTNVHHAYYKEKLKQFVAEINKPLKPSSSHTKETLNAEHFEMEAATKSREQSIIRKSVVDTLINLSKNDDEARDSEKAKLIPVSFSIKSKEAEPIIEKTPFQYESSSDEDEVKTEKPLEGVDSSREAKTEKVDSARLKAKVKKKHSHRKARQPSISAEKDSPVDKKKCDSEPAKNTESNLVDFIGCEIVSKVDDDAERIASLQQDRKRRAREFLQKMRKKLDEPSAVLAHAMNQNSTERVFTKVAESEAVEVLTLSLSEDVSDEEEVVSKKSSRTKHHKSHKRKKEHKHKKRKREKY